MSTWGEVLKKAGYPSIAIVLDFETYFDTNYSLKKMSTVEYVLDKRFEILGFGGQTIGENDTLFVPADIVKPALEEMTKAHGPEWDCVTVVSQNSKFEGLILQEHFGITPRYTIDIIDLDRIWDARAKHSLEAMAKRWKAPTLKGDTKQFKGYRWADMSPEMRKALAEYGKNDIDIESFLFQKLLPLVPNPEIELPLATQTLQLYLKPQIQIDMQLGQELKQKMKLEMVRPRLELRKLGIKAGRKTISGNKKFVELLNQYTDVPLKQGKNGAIPALAKDDEGLKQLLNHPKPEIRWLAESRKAIKSWPLHIARVDSLMNQARCRDGKIGSPLSFYAAMTGRWGGTEKINLENMGGRGRTGSGTHPLIRNVRGMLQAPSGYIFGMVDYAQIEFRLTAWYAGQEDLIQALADGRDIYSEFATNDLFRTLVRKPKETDPEPVKRMLTFKRGFAKDGMLGFTYGMGALRLFDDCRKNDILRPLIDSGQYDWEFFNRMIKTLRQKYSKIPDLWGKLEKAWVFVTKYPHEVAYASQCPIEKLPRLKFEHIQGSTFIILPSGRYLRYPNARVKNKRKTPHDGKLSYKYARSIWGGHLTENIMQATSRDIMGEALLRLEDAGIGHVFHVYDEVISLFKKSEAEQKLKEMMEIMSVVPNWATGLPIAVEGELSERYKK